MSTILKTLSAAALAVLTLTSAAKAEVSEHFIIHEVTQTPQEAATLIRDFIAMNDDWSLNGDFEMMGGAAVGMKICFNAMRGFVGAAGLHNLALMPCGNIAFYEEGGQSYLSMLDVGYITLLSPHPSLEEGVALARPAYVEMFTEVLGVK
ncbi:hypothetical protein [Aestuariicoccus sp. MJ-SS9]|uniref:hypothetical protein n=1 Tax=Aestuariicoccus sp. MJ-SS9 TaxID=3079855 RepID=UPI00291237F1|nr:hypothetical protein [Aestuariicoccus sp. MJ-SS9]MDU8913538.1 hypothetical protein [Aestuariicoccus sp. MJ-SS9]